MQLLVLYRACALPVFDDGDVAYDNCSVTDANLLECVQTAAAKLVVGCSTTTSREKILNELGLTPLHLRRQFHILIALCNIDFGPCPCSKFFKYLCNYSSIFHLSV